MAQAGAKSSAARSAEPARAALASSRRGAQRGARAQAASLYCKGVAQNPNEEAEVIMAVESLYNDQLRPYGRILRKRLCERALEAGRGEADIDASRLKSLCEQSPWLTVRPESGDDWSATLLHRAANFVDVYNPSDPYSPALWAAAAEYFAGLSGVEMVLPGGRYLCARELEGRRLPFLASCSLGQVCHIVQLGISQKKLLGYKNGSIVPYGRSQSMVKDRCAKSMRPCRGQEANSGGAAGWQALREGLKELLDSSVNGERAIPLSSLKRIFLSRFRLELSETSLGYAKLSELFQAPELADLCEVKLQGPGYVLLPSQRQRISLAEGLQAPSEGSLQSSLRSRAPWITQLGPEALLEPQSPARQATAGSAQSTATPAMCYFPPTPSPYFASSWQRQGTWQLPRLLGSARGTVAIEKQGFLAPPAHYA